MGLTGLYFVVTGIQYWTPNYLEVIFGVEQRTITIYFTVTSLSAPILGVVIGGIITQMYGGYNAIKAQKIQIIAGIFAVASALPIPFFHE